MSANTNEQLNKRIMRRVYFIWFAKKAAPYFIAELALFSGFLYLIGRYVFVSKVMQYAGQILANNSIDPATWSSFAFHIFSKTTFIVQLSVLGSLAMIALMFRGFIKSFIQLNLAKEETNLTNRSF